MKLAPSPRGCPPDYIGVGTANAGCAWWHKLLLKHPAVKRPAAGRSLEFFATFCTRAMTDEDVSAYHAHFARGEKKVIGEWTSDYIHQAWTPMLLQRAAPDAKLLVMLMNPVDRYATNLAGKRDRDTQPSLAESLARGLYAEQLRGLLDYYARDQILVLQRERCAKEPVAEYERTLRFLGVDPGFRPKALETGWPRRKRAELWPDIEVPLRKALEADVRELRELVPDLDLSLWPEFAHLGERGPDTPALHPTSV